MCFIKANLKNKVHLLHQEMKHKKILFMEASSVSLLKFYVKNKDIVRAEEFFQDILAFETKPTHVMYTMMINVSARVYDSKKAEHYFMEMKKRGIPFTDVPYNILINSYGAAKQFAKMEDLFQEMVAKGIKPTSHTYNSIIKAYVGGKNKQKILQYFSEMKSVGHIQPDTTTYNLLLDYYRRTLDLEQAEATLASFQEVGKPDIITYNTLLDLYSKLNLYTKVEALFEQLKKEAAKDASLLPDNVTYGTVIVCHVKRNDPTALNKARGIYKEMLSRGIPDTLEQVIRDKLKSHKHKE